MAHGFLASFPDWAAEKTDQPREAIEAAVAHVVQSKVEAAYARSDLSARRWRLIDDWAVYPDPRPTPPEHRTRANVSEGGRRGTARRKFGGESHIEHVPTHVHHSNDRQPSAAGNPAIVKAANETAGRRGAPPRGQGHEVEDHGDVERRSGPKVPRQPVISPKCSITD